MATHRLVIWRHERLLGHFDSTTPWSEEAVKDIAGHLHASDGYRVQCLVAHSERRLVESGPAGIRVLGIEPDFQPTTLPC